MAAPDGAGGFDVLFESQLDAAQAGTVRIGDAVVRVDTPARRVVLRDGLL